ncbi:MAG: CHAT domain-containing protein [Acidobacteriota bacterium]|nr:CHAT domain-containing protein [Acidobacteriota bacterium]
MLAEADALVALHERSASERAVELYERALEIWEREGEHLRGAQASERVGTLFLRAGALEAALAHFERGLSLARATNDEALKVRLLAQLGQVTVLLGDHERGSEQCFEAQTLAVESAAPAGEAIALDCLGEAEYHRGDLSAALGYHGRSLALWRQVGDRRGEADALLDLGSVFSDLSEPRRAGEHFERSLALWRQVSDRRGEALALVGLARLYDRTADYQTALNVAREALALIEPTGDLTWQASVQMTIGSVYEHLGEIETAARYWRTSLELYRRAGLRVAEVDVLMWLGHLEHAAGNDEVAVEYLNEALELSRELANPRLTADVLAFLGLVHANAGRNGEALRHYRQALAVLPEGEYRRSEAFVLNQVARVHAAQLEFAAAADRARQAITLSRQAQDPLGEAAGLENLARLAAAQQDLATAQQHIEASLALSESLRVAVDSQDLRSSYLAAIQPRFELWIDLLMRRHTRHSDHDYAAAALHASERARARSLLETLSEAHVELRQDVAPDLLTHERRLRAELDEKVEQIMRLASAGGDPGVRDVLEGEIEDLSQRYNQLQAEIRSRSPRYVALTQPDPLDLPGIRELLDRETILLEYFLGEERSYLWLVTATGMTSYELPPRAEIEVVARELHALLTARLPLAEESFAEQRRRIRTADERYWPVAKELVRILLEPVADQIAGKRLLVVSDGALRYIPFAALPVPGHDKTVPLVVEHEIVHLPSASTLGLLRKETAGREQADMAVAVLADPVFEADDPRLSAQRETGAPEDETHRTVTRSLRQLGMIQGERLAVPRLVATRREAEEIVSLAPVGSSYAALGFEASRETAMSSKLAAYRIVHFATHGIVNGDNPGLSGVVLSMVDDRGQPQNGFLRLHDIYNLELPVELVVLSACNSALGKEIRGEGIVGLVRGFMYAGARRVVASLWKVDDEATSELMGEFYRHMLSDGRSPAAALRLTQIEMWRHKQWSPPFYWAAFTLQGEWQ